MLRPTFFMENILNNFSESIKTQGKFYVSHGAGRVTYIAARDIAGVEFGPSNSPLSDIFQKRTPLANN